MRKKSINYRIIALCLLTQLFFSTFSLGQKNSRYADSLRTAYQIPELAYAVITKDSTIEISFSGHHANNLPDTASVTDRFHIGSNTKAMTAFIIAKAVEKNQIKWDTKFFDLFPEWKKDSNPAYLKITLQDLLSHRARIQPFTAGEEWNKVPKFKGTKVQKRKSFGHFVLSQKPVDIDTSSKYTYSNAGYTLAALMLEKVANKSWEDMVLETFNRDLNILTGFSWPNNQSKQDTWGHLIENNKLTPLASTIEYNLNYIEPAGDLNLTLPDYIKFIQLNLKGLNNLDNYLSASTYNFLHRCRENYAMGWANIIENNTDLSSHAGSAGTYFTMVDIDRRKGIGYIIFANSATESATQGIDQLMRKLKER